LTYGERRKRADIKQVLKDMDLVESAFLSDAQKLNKKRQAQMIKRVNKAIEELYTAHEKGDETEKEGILKALKMPSSKEWYKIVDRLVTNAVEVGMIRAHIEALRLRELYEFKELDVKGEYGYEVVLPEEARKWLKEYGYSIGIITEETERERIRKAIEDSLDRGMSPREAQAHVKNTIETWISDWHAETIARTETAKMYNAGRLARWIDPEEGGFVEALQYDAIVDTRTTDLCRHLDGKIISVKNSSAVAKYTPPNHFNCRATWLPVSKFEDWVDDFPLDLQPEKGFTHEPELPNLLKGQRTEPLVQKVIDTKKNPKDITDPFEIRELPDEEFKIAIGNIQDIGLKLTLIMERAEKMMILETGMTQVENDMKFFFWGMETATTGMMELFGQEIEFSMSEDMKPAIEELTASIYVAQKVNNDEARKVLAEFYEKHAGDARFADMITKLRQHEKDSGSKPKWTGLKPVEDRTEEATKAYTIKRPPLTKNFKNATGLRDALDKGEEWIKKYVDNKLAPTKKPLKLRFQHDLTRAYATGSTGEIYFGKYETDFGVVVHESAHVMHWQTPEIRDLVNEWFMKRTDYLQKETSSRYGEKVIPDDFFSSYIGRIYGWEERIAKHYNIEGFYGQEVLSMGLQEMASDPLKFYKVDKEHFLFTYAIMRGLF
jgi:SPP1 gp7 family putative phage head morphogenesis protein